MDPSEMTVRELKALVEGRGLEVPNRAKKADLVALLADEPVAAAAPAEPAPTALWTVVDDECLAWVRMMSEHHSMPEDDIVRGMLYCAFNSLRKGGPVRGKRAIDSALKDTTHRGRWV
jgi:hypothetical protein